MSPADSVELVLVRHGRTAWNAEGRFLGRSDLPLDAQGAAAAEAWAAAGAVGPVDAVYASPLRRALETAVRIGPLTGTDDGLRELDQGELEGQVAMEALATRPAWFRQWRDDPTGVVLPGGESLDACRDRCLAALARIAARHTPGQRVAVVGHQLALASALTALAGEPLSRWRAWGLEHLGARPVWVDAGGRWHVTGGPR